MYYNIISFTFYDIIRVVVILFQTTARLKKERPVRTAHVSIHFAIVTTVTADVRVKSRVSV